MSWIAASNVRAFVVLFVLAFGLRLLALWLWVPPDLIPPNPDWETGAVAISLTQGDGFADPYIIPTGPTSHMPPLSIWVSAFIYRIFGIGYLGGFIYWVFCLLCAALLWASLPWVADRLGLPREAGVIGGFLGAVSLGFPSEIEPLAGLAMAGSVGLFVGRWRSEAVGPGPSLFLGLILGLALLHKPALLPVFLGLLVFEVVAFRRRSRGWAGAAAVTLGMVLVCVPWTVRNYVVFNELIFIRGNFGLELAMGNHPGAHPDIDVMVAQKNYRHPRSHLAEAERILEIGEGPYMRERQSEAMTWIRQNPGEFLTLTSLRVAYFWLGPLHTPDRAAGYSLLFVAALLGFLAGWPTMDGPGRAAILIPLLTYPLVYYVLGYLARYGEPLRWVLFLLAGVAVWRAWRAVARSGSFTPI